MDTKIRGRRGRNRCRYESCAQVFLRTRFDGGTAGTGVKRRRRFKFLDPILRRTTTTVPRHSYSACVQPRRFTTSHFPSAPSRSPRPNLYRKPDADKLRVRNNRTSVAAHTYARHVVGGGRAASSTAVCTRRPYIFELRRTPPPPPPRVYGEPSKLVDDDCYGDARPFSFGRT